MDRYSVDELTLTVCPSLVRYAWSNAAWLAPLLFPPRQRKTFHKAVLGEILQERCVQPQQDQRTRRKTQNEQLFFASSKAAAYTANRALNSDQKPLREQYWG